MTQDSLFLRNELFIATAAIGAHATCGDQGFRQRDVKFLTELFINWASPKSFQEAPFIQNTQVMRYLVYLQKEGYLHFISRKKPPLYRLTRIGLLELASRVVQRRCYPERENFFFLFYFLKEYKPHIEALVKAEGRLFPYSMKVELEALLDTRALIHAELEHAKKELDRMNERIEASYGSAELIRKSIAKGMAFPEAVREVERVYPYELNSLKPLTELIGQIPPHLQRWEIETGSVLRSKQIWEPIREMVKEYIKELKKLESLQ